MKKFVLKKLSDSKHFVRLSKGLKFLIGNYDAYTYSVNPNFMMGRRIFDFVGGN